MLRSDRFDACLDALYGSLCDPNRVSDALEAIRTFTDSGSCTVASFDPDGNVAGFAAAGIDLEPQGAWLRYYSGLDPRRSVAMAARPGQWVTDDRLLDPLHSPSREYVNDFALPVGWRWMRGGKVYAGPWGSATLCLQRPANQKAFDDAALRQLDQLLPHAQRACGLMLELNRRLPALSAAFSALDLLDIPMCLVDGDGRVLHGNKAGDDVLARSRVATLCHGRLVALGADAGQQLRDAIHAACLEFPRRAAAFTLHDPSPTAGNTPPQRLHVRVLPLPLVHHFLARAGEPHALVLLDSGPRGLDAQQLQSLFGLSPSEAQLVVLLAAGHPAKTCARLRGVGLPTVRTQIASVLAKTGATSQPQLMALMGSLTPLH